MRRSRKLISAMALALALPAVCSLPRAQQGAGAPGATPPARVAPGQKVPPLKLKALFPSSAQARELDLGASLGRKPVVICHIVLGEGFGEQTLLEVQSLGQGPLRGKIDLFGATRPGGRLSVAQTAERLARLGVEVPFILEEDTGLGAMLGATGAPAIALIDGAGVLRVADGRSLRQEVARNLSLGMAIENAASGRPVPTAGSLPIYYPANELVGRPSADFSLKTFEGARTVTLSESVARDRKESKITVLFFWHPDSAPSRNSLPSILVGYNAYSKWLDLISIVDAKNADEARSAREAIRAHNIGFPVLQDEARRVSDQYRVVSTPTFIFLKQDGTIDSVYTRDDVNYVTIFSARIRSILGLGPRKN